MNATAAESVEVTSISLLDDRIAIRMDEAPGKSAGGIVLPEMAKEKPQRGTVVAVGKGKILDSGSLRPMTLAVGDRVLCDRYAGLEIEVDGEDLRILAEHDVIAKLNS